MLKRDITYEDFDGNKVTETFYFNITKPELVELEYDVEGGFTAWLEEIIKTKDSKQIIATFKKIVLLAVGQRSEDGKRFIKSDKIRDEFAQTNAYNEIFMELATDDNAASNFILAVVPRDMAGTMAAAADAREVEEVKASVLNAPESSPHSS